jgi:hypothetical protein
MMHVNPPARFLKLPWKIQGRAAYENLKQKNRSLRQSWNEMARRASSAWPQVCFLHLAKTAGCSINEILRSRFNDASGVGLKPEKLDQEQDHALEHHGLVSAHFSIRHLPLLNEHRFLFTFLRNPVDRVVSSYYHLNGYTGVLEPANIALMSAKTKSFHDFLCDDHPQVRSFTENLQANALVSDWRGEKRTAVDDLGGRAIESLAQFDFVGLFERYEESLQVLFRALHWRLHPHEAAVVINKTRARPPVAAIEPRSLALIRELNQADQQLYDYVAEVWKSRPGLVSGS